ncbi:MAG: SDR family oxidoreductase [Gammaproteobacteria bacterium]
MQTRREILQASSALALTSLLPACTSLSKGGQGQSPNPAAIEEIPRSDYGFETTADDVLAGIDLSGKTVMLTGCNSGLGYASLKSLAKAGAHVIGTARTQEKAETACASVGGKTTPLVCELTDMDSVQACAGQVMEPVDVLICNAGIMALPKLTQVEVNGMQLEKQFVVNHLGHFLLTLQLMPQLLQADSPRVVMVSSMGYTLAPKGGILFDDLSGDNKYQAFKNYGQSKLANILFANELSRRYQGSPLTANSIHPGLVSTNLGRYMRGDVEGTSKKPDRPLRKGMKTSAQGASTQVYVATDPRLADVTGYYFADCNPEAYEGEYATDPALASLLWRVSEEIVAPWL